MRKRESASKLDRGVTGSETRAYNQKGEEFWYCAGII